MFFLLGQMAVRISSIWPLKEKFKHMKNNSIPLKIILFSVGLFVMAVGVALSVKADLGVSPISCIPYVYSFKMPFSLGTLTIFFNLILIVIQIGILRRKYRLLQLLQLPVVFAFGVFIDLALYFVSDLNVSNYYWQAFWCLVSCVVIALGVFLEVKAKLTYLPGEGLAMAIADTLNKEFGKAKIGVDSAMVMVGLISSFIFLFQLEGIREGTIVAAVLVGFIAKFFHRKIHILDSWLGLDVSKASDENVSDSIENGSETSHKNPVLIQVDD